MSMSRFLQGEQFVCWHNHGSVSETRHLITVGNKSWHVSSQGKGISLLAAFIRNKTGSKTEKEKLQNLSRTSWFPVLDHHHMYQLTMSLYITCPLALPFSYCIWSLVPSCLSICVLKFFLIIFNYCTQIQRVCIYTVKKTVHRITDKQKKN